MSGITNAISLNIDIGDQPYYTYGPGYWSGGVYWVWPDIGMDGVTAIASGYTAITGHANNSPADVK